MTAVAVKNKSEILKRVAKGDKIADIGKCYGVTQQAISKQLLSDPEWIDARMSGTLARIEHWEKEIEALRKERLDDHDELMAEGKDNVISLCAFRNK